MKKDKKDMPVRSEINRVQDDQRNKQQDEYDISRKPEMDRSDEAQQDAKEERYKDSQLNHEQMIPSEKKKQTEKWDKVDRKLPNTKK